MIMGTNWSKSASATSHPPRTARAQRGVIQHATNWHAFPVMPPLTDTEIEKKHHHHTVFGRLFTIPHKIRGTNRKTRYAKKRQTRMGHGSSFFHFPPRGPQTNVNLESQHMTQTQLQLQQSSTVSVMLFLLLTSSILYSQYSTPAAPRWPLVATRSQSAAAALSHRPTINCHIHWHACGTWRHQAHRTAHSRPTLRDSKHLQRRTPQP